jgi:hypothetical protein
VLLTQPMIQAWVLQVAAWLPERVPAADGPAVADHAMRP